MEKLVPVYCIKYSLISFSSNSKMLSGRNNNSEIDSVYTCIGFLNNLQFTMCCSGAWKENNKFRTNHVTRIYACSATILLLCGLIGTIYTQVQDPLQWSRIEQLDKLLLSIACLEFFMSILLFMSTVISMQCQANRYSNFFESIKSLDLRLENDFNANLNYHKLKRKNVLVILTVVVIYVSAVCSGIARMAQDDFWIILIGACCYTIITGGPHLNGYVHMNLAEILKIRFRLLQQLLNKDYLMLHFPEDLLRIERIKTAVQMVLELHRLITEINSIYQSSLLSARLHDFTLTTSELYVIFGHSTGFEIGSLLLSYVVLCMLPPFYKMTISPIYCDITIKEGNKCLHLIEEIENWLPQNNEIKRFTSFVMMWRLKNKIEFTTGLGIPLNKANMTIVAAVILNYLLILIQFHMTELMSDQIDQQKNVLQEWIGVID